MDDCRINCEGSLCTSNCYGKKCTSICTNGDCSFNCFGGSCIHNCSGNLCNNTCIGGHCTETCKSDVCYFNCEGGYCPTRCMDGECHFNCGGGHCTYVCDEYCDIDCKDSCHVTCKEPGCKVNCGEGCLLLCDKDNCDCIGNCTVFENCASGSCLVNSSLPNAEILVINFDWQISNKTIYSNNIVVLKNNSFEIDPDSVLITNGDLIAEGNFSIHLNNAAVPLIIKGCLISNQTVTIYVPSDSQGLFPILSHNANCSIPNFNVVGLDGRNCQEIITETNEVQMTIYWRITKNCSPANNTLFIILGVAFGLLFIGIIVAIIYQNHKERAREDALEQF